MLTECLDCWSHYRFYFTFINFQDSFETDARDARCPPQIQQFLASIASPFPIHTYIHKNSAISLINDFKAGFVNPKTQAFLEECCPILAAIVPNINASILQVIEALVSVDAREYETHQLPVCFQ